MNFDTLIAYLTQVWSKGGSRPTTLVLVKLIYLLDLYNAKETGKTITGWTWHFHHFGPYCTESFKAIENAVKYGHIFSDTHDSRYDEENSYKTFYRDSEEADISATKMGIPVKVSVELTKTVRSLNFDSNKLLNHVYHQTEPMMDATPHTDLKFEDLCWPQKDEGSKLIKLSNSKINAAKEILKKLDLRTAVVKTASQPIYDDVYFTGITSLNSLDTSAEFGFSGTASIKDLFKKNS